MHAAPFWHSCLLPSRVPSTLRKKIDAQQVLRRFCHDGAFRSSRCCGFSHSSGYDKKIPPPVIWKNRPNISGASVKSISLRRLGTISSPTSLNILGTDDTIYALSTAPGRAAIAIIRVSGPACLEVWLYTPFTLPTGCYIERCLKS